MDFMKKLKYPENISFLTTFVIGFATHLFGFLNVIHNYDDIGVLPKGYGATLKNGRWLLMILYKLLSKIGITYNLPYINAVLFILLISVSVFIFWLKPKAATTTKMQIPICIPYSFIQLFCFII